MELPTRNRFLMITHALYYAGVISHCRDPEMVRQMIPKDCFTVNRELYAAIIYMNVGLQAWIVLQGWLAESDTAPKAIEKGIKVKVSSKMN